MNTVAEPSDNGYKITGQKIFITWGEHDLSENIIHLVLARLPDAPEGVKGISLFLVPKFKMNADGTLGERNTLKAVSVEHKLGIHGCATCVMSFEEAEGFLVGEPNQGLACMFTMMNDARIGVACESVAIAERAYQQAVNYAKDRIQGKTESSQSRVSIINHPDVRRMLLSMKSLIEVMRVLVYENTFECDLAESKSERNQRADLLTPITKAWCSELCQDITSIALQVHGGMGYVEETGAAQHFRDARITTIYEGTTGIQANDLVGRKFINDNGSAMNQLLDQIENDIGVSSIEDNLKSELNHAIEKSRNVSQFILENAQKDPNLAGASSYNFLMMMGYLVGGW
ncbi:MAG: acyl-CoA dehydrogenase, partial [Pseudomonadota bacterium]|nr:acyl-CoA dehydrogenase [Pseudomonadota bacterium]